MIDGVARNFQSFRQRANAVATAAENEYCLIFCHGYNVTMLSRHMSTPQTMLTAFYCKLRYMETLGDKIRKARKNKGLTQAALGKLIGVTSQAVNQWENKPNTHIRPTHLFKLERQLKISAHDLYEAIPFLTADATANDVPLLTWHKLSQLSVGIVELERYTDVRMLPCPLPHSDKTFALTIEGGDMEPKFRVGEIIFCDPKREPFNGDFIIVRALLGAFPILRQLMIEPSGHRFLRSLNPSWPQSIIPLSESGEILATVIFKGEEL